MEDRAAFGNNNDGPLGWLSLLISNMEKCSKNKHGQRLVDNVHTTEKNFKMSEIIRSFDNVRGT